MKQPVRLPVIAILLALAGCGGGLSISVGDDDWDGYDDPRPSGRSASVEVGAATRGELNGTYATRDAWVGSVLRFDAEPDSCRFRFDGLRQQGAGVARVMRGDVHYLVDTGVLVVTRIAVGGEEFRADGGGTLDRSADEVRYDGAIFRSTLRSGEVLTITGRIPLRDESRPHRC